MRYRFSHLSCVVAFAAVAITALTPSTARAQWTQIQELSASDGSFSDWFGYSLAVSGDTAVIGTPLADVATAVDAGAAYVFNFNGTQWVQAQKLTASDGAASDNFGVSVAIDGKVIVVGAYRADPSGSDSGAAYVYRNNGSSWVEEQKLTASDGAASDNFGRAVAVKNDVIAVGSPFDDIPTGTDVGSVYMYRYKGSVLLWQEEQKVNAIGGASSDYLGFSLAMVDHDTVLAGAYLHDVPSFFDAGAVYEFVHAGSSWSQDQEITASNPGSSDQFGYSLAVDGGTLVIGAWATDVSGTSFDVGSAYVFRNLSGVWVEEDQLKPTNGQSFDYFGTSVAVKGNLVLVGSQRHDEVFTDSGAAYLFRYVGSACGWIEQLPEFVGKDRGSSDWLGSSAALTDHGALSGAYLRDAAGFGDSGAVYVFDTREFLLSITPTTVSAGQKITFDSMFGLPNDPVMLVVRDINGTPFFAITLIARFTANYDWAFTTTVPTGLSGLNVTFQSFKESDPCRAKALGTNQVTVHFQ